MITTDPRRRRRSTALVIGLTIGLALAAHAAADEGQAAGEAPAERPVKEIKMYADNWSWSPSTIRVEAGTLLRIAVDNVDATHRFDLKEYGLKVMLPQDQTTTIEFVADKPGEFRWKCGRPCGDGCAKMTGKLIVTEAPAAAPKS
jgi:plastocyanin